MVRGATITRADAGAASRTCHDLRREELAGRNRERRAPSSRSGTVGVARRPVDAAESRRASRRVVGRRRRRLPGRARRRPRRRRLRLVPGGAAGARRAPARRRRGGARVLEVGAGSAPCSRWLPRRGRAAGGARPLRGHAAPRRRAGPRPPASRCRSSRPTPSQLPFRDGSFDLACSAFGAVPFVADPGAVMREVARVLRPGGRWVFAVNHPMRWMFSDDPGPDGLVVRQSYFDRMPYVEVDDARRRHLRRAPPHARRPGARRRRRGPGARRPRRAGVARGPRRRCGASGPRCAASSSPARRSSAAASPASSPRPRRGTPPARAGRPAARGPCPRAWWRPGRSRRRSRTAPAPTARSAPPAARSCPAP